MFIRPSAMAFAVAASCPALAAPPTTEAPLRLAELIVTATRTHTRSEDVLASVEVIDRETLETAGQGTLVDLLANVPGLRLSTSGGAGATASLFTRGTESRHTLVLIDGMRIGSATSGQPALETIPLGAIERIEILRGPASALYGSEALGGVIQIFTRRGDGQGVKPHLFAGYGSQQTWQLQAGVTGTSERLRYNVAAGYSDTDGINSNPDPIKQPNYYQPDRDGYRNRHVSANVALGLREQDEIGLNLLYSNGRNDFDAFKSDYPAWLDKTLSVGSVFLTNQLAPGWRSTLRVGLTEDTLKNHSSAEAPSHYRTRQQQFVWQHDIALAGGALLAAYEHLSQKVDGSTTYTQDARRIHAFLLGWRGQSGAHTFQLNGRHDRNSQFGGKTTGLLAYGYQLSARWHAHASLATAFNAPTFNQLYWPDNGYGGGNPALKPEKALNREIGVRYDDGLHALSLSYYNNRVRELITGWPPANVATARLEGIELGYRGELLGYTLETGVDLLRARDEATGKALPRRAEEAGFLRLSRTLGPWHWGMSWNGQGGRFDDTANTRRMGGYGLLDAWVHYALDRNLRLEMRASNLLDKQHETVWGYGTPGASLFVGVRYAPR